MSETPHSLAARLHNNAGSINHRVFHHLPFAAVLTFIAANSVSTYAESAIEEVRLTNAIVITAPQLSSPVTTNINLDETPALQAAADGAAVLTQIPGFSAVSNGGSNADPTFRGMFGSRLAILTDGAQMLGACPSRMDNPSAYINPAAYDSVVVVKGPQTVLWGVGASAATIRFDRKREDFSNKDSRLDASATVGTYGRFDRRLEGAVGNHEGYMRIEANESEANDYKDGNGDVVASAWEKWNTNLALGWTPDEDTWLEVEAGRGDGNARYAGRMMDGSMFLRETVALRFEKKNLSEHLSQLEAQLNYGYADHVMDNYSLRPVPAMKRRSQVDRRTQSGRIASTWDWDDYSLVAGVDAKHEVHRRARSQTSDGVVDYVQDQAGLFSEATFYLENDNRLITGLRLDQIKVTDKNTNTATAGDTRRKNLTSGFVRWERDLASLPATAYLGLGHAERFADYWEIKPSNKSLSGAVNAFAGVQPEKTTQIDVGFNYHSQNVSWWVSGYVGMINDYIIFDYTGATAMQTSVGNVDAYIAGAETGVRYPFNDVWSANASMAYAWGKDTDNHAPLPQIAPLESKLGLTFEQEAWTVNTVLRLVAQQDRIALNRGNVVGKDFKESTGFGTLDFNTEYRINRHITWRVGVDNLTDKAYSEHLNLAGNAAFGYASNETFKQSGRMIWTSINASF